MATTHLTGQGFLLRWLFALALVLLSYNPTPYSFVGWVLNQGEGAMVYKVIAGIVLIIGWVIYIRATKNSLGPIGAGLAAALFGCIVWLFIEWGLFEATDLTIMTWLIEVILSLILALGMSWSHIRRRLSGQIDTDDVED